MKYSKLKLLQLLQNVPRQGWTWQKIKDLVDSLWRDSSTEEDPKFFSAINASKHYTGFPDRTATSLLFDDASFTLFLTATANPIWVNGIEYLINTLSKTLSPAQEAVSGLYWFWITDPDGVPQLNVDIQPPGFDKCIVATAYWNTTTKKGMLSDERHWMGRDKWMHEYLHETVGARYSSGMAGTFTDTTISIKAGEFYDEDIEHDWDDPQTEVEVLYHNGSAAWEWDALSTPYKVLSPGINNNLRYNNGNNLATVDNNKYANYWVFATADTSHPIHVVIGTAQYTTITLARAAAVPSLGALVSAEAKLIFKATYQNNSGSPRFMEAADYRTSSNLPATGYVPTDHGSLSGLTDDDHPQYSKTDQLVKFNAEDPTAGFLSDKIIQGAGITISEGTGANENKLVITANPTADTGVQVSIDFIDASILEFVYNCPVALVFTSQISEGADATISPALNTNMAQYGKVTVTSPGVGLIVLLGNTL